MFDTYLISNPPDPRSYVLNSVLDDFIATPDPNKRTSKPHCVYRLFNHKNTLLYVGISWSAAARLSQHYHTKLWFTEVVTATLEWFPTLREAKIAETQAIKTECPLYNIAEVCA